MQKREANVINYYVLCNKLKDVIRTGWKDWNVGKERLESVAEHIYGTQMLAIAMWSEYQEDYKKMYIPVVLSMLAVHELEEVVIGDLTLFQISKEEKDKKGKEGVSKILGNLCMNYEIEELIDEFNGQNTLEAKFAYFCDKLECCLQARLYDEGGYIDLNSQQGNKTMEDKVVQKYLNEGKSFSEMWTLFWQGRVDYDKNFKAVSDYAISHNIKDEAF